MKSEEILQLQKNYLIGTYSADIVLTKGEGCYVWDNSGKRYLDFTSGISVNNLGHCHPRISEAVQNQAKILVHVSNLFINENQPKLAESIAKKSFDGRLFFANSGAEANEGMIKFARKWGNTTGKNEIVYMSNSFHGRTLATLAGTDKPIYRDGFSPHVEGFVRATFNDITSIEKVITEKTAAILLEPVQGEGGIHPANVSFLAEVKELCNNKEILLLFDEVQCGMGRTGHYFAYQHYNIEPDAMSLAKALGNGFPIGAFEIQRKWEHILPTSSHASTFGGSPLACAAALAVFETFDKENILSNCKEMGEVLRGKLDGLKEKYSQIKEIRGIGLMIGIEGDFEAKEILKKTSEYGVLILSAGENILRLLPPLTITPKEIDKAIHVLDQIFSELSV